MYRREFLRASVLAGAAAATGAHWSVSLASPYGLRKRIIVIGGGIGGLSCGYELMKRGHDVVVMEVSGRPGGHVHTVDDQLASGLYADAGAEHFTRPGYEIFWEYVEELGLTALPYPRRKNIRYYRDGAFHSEETLNAPSRLRKQGFNQREIRFLGRNPNTSLRQLYFRPYLDAFEDEYDPFAAGLRPLDRLTVTELLRREKASEAAVRRAGGSGSALQQVWEAAILHLRGVPPAPTDLWRIEGGNQHLTDALAARLAPHVRLGCEATHIRHGEVGVTVTCRELGMTHDVEADYLVCCMPLSMLARIPVTPPWSEAKQYVIENTGYTTESRVILQSRTRFWKEEGMSPNLVFGEPALTHVWATAQEVDTHRGLLLGDAVGVGDAEKALSTFRALYPGRRENIEYVQVVAWPMDQWAAHCNRASFPLGELHKFWPEIMEPEGRVYFAGASFDNLNWGMEAATRSARRVATAIDAA